MPTTPPQEIDCPECGGEGSIEFGSGDHIDHVETCETCRGTRSITVVACPLHGLEWYGDPAHDRDLNRGGWWCCYKCMTDTAAPGSSDELGEVNRLLSGEVEVSEELIALALKATRGEDYDDDRWVALFHLALRDATEWPVGPDGEVW